MTITPEQLAAARKLLEEADQAEIDALKAQDAAAVAQNSTPADEPVVAPVAVAKATAGPRLVSHKDFLGPVWQKH